MAENLGGIYYDIEARTDGLLQGERQVKRSTRSITGDFDRTSKAADRTNFTLKRLAGTIGSVLAVRQIKNYVVNTAQAIDEQGKFSEQLGISFESLQRIQFAAEQSGASITQLNNSLRRGRRNIAQAASEGGKTADSIREIGLSVEALNAMSVDDQFMAVADALSEVEDQGRQAAIAYQLFGRDGEFLLNTLRQGSDGIRQLGDDAERTGRILSQEAADNAAKFNDELNRLSGAVGGVVKGLGVELLPVMSEIIEAWTDLLSDGERVESILNLIGTAAASTAAIFTARFIGSLSQAAIGFVAAQIQAARYQATLASMAGVSRGAAASQVALSRAVAGARSAFALIGGPMGAIFIAATAITYWISQSDKAASSAERLKGEVDGLIDSFEDMGRSTTIRQLEQFEAQAEETKDRLSEIQDEIKRIQDQARLETQMGDKSANIRALQAIAKLQEESQELTDDLHVTNEAAFELQKRLYGIAEGGDPFEVPTSGVEDLGEAARRAISPVQAVMDQLNREYRGIKPGDDPFADPEPDEPDEPDAPRDPGDIGLTRIQALEAQYEREREILEESLLAEEEIDARKTELYRQFSEERQAIMEQEKTGFLGALEEMGLSFAALENQAVGTITNMATGLQSSSDAARDLGRAIITQIVGALVKTAAAKAVETAMGVAQAGVLAAAYQPAAISASIATGGAAATSGAAAVIGATNTMTAALNMGPGRLGGGKVSPDMIYPVTEDGKPELLMQGGRQYLLPGSRGEVVSNRNMTQHNAGDSINVEMNVNAGGGITSDQLSNLLFDSNIQNNLYSIMQRQSAKRGRKL